MNEVDPTSLLPDLPRHRPLDERDAEAWSRAHRLLIGSNDAEYESQCSRRKLRVLTRVIQGRCTAEEAARALGWAREACPPHVEAIPLEEGVERVRDEIGEWVGDERPWPKPLAEVWSERVFGIEQTPPHPWVMQARKTVEARADRRDALWYRLILRLRVVGGALTEKEAATRANLSLAAWQAFCAAEDEATPGGDHDYREGWVLDVSARVEALSAHPSLTEE